MLAFILYEFELLVSFEKVQATIILDPDKATTLFTKKIKLIFIGEDMLTPANFEEYSSLDIHATGQYELKVADLEILFIETE